MEGVGDASEIRKTRVELVRTTHCHCTAEAFYHSTTTAKHYYYYDGNVDDDDASW